MKLLLIAALLITSSANAIDFEIGIGQTDYQRSPNGIWWQNGFDHSFDLRANSINLGVSDYVTESIKWRVGYTHLGTVSSWALAVPDAQYNMVNGCHSPSLCELDQYIGKGSIEGIYLTMSPEMKIGSVKLFMDAGLWGYFPHFNMKVYRGATPRRDSFWDVHTDEHMQFGPVLGVGVEYEKVQLVATIYASQVGGVEPNTIPFWGAYTPNLTVKMVF